MTEAARLEGIIALTGLSQAQAGLVGLGREVDKTQAKVDGLGATSTRASKQTDELGKKLISAGRDAQSVGRTLTRGVTLPLVAVSAAMMKVGADFDEQMSKVGAKSGATAAEMAKLRAQALKLGADTAFSAKEAAQGMEELAAAGMKPQQVLAAMPGLLDAAAASGEGVGAVAAIVANSLAQFNLEASESTRIADVLAKGSNETQASIGSMGEALKYAGTQASQLGFDLEQTVGMTSMMVKAGIDGGQAGTALRMGLMQTAKGANASKIALKKLAGVSPELAKIWKSAAPVPEKIKLMSTEFQKLDGTTRTVAAGLIFGTEASSGMLEVMRRGPAEIDKWTSSMRDSGGEAKRMGDIMRNNLKGDVEALGGSIESAMINMFDQANGPMRGFTQGLTGAVNAFGSMGPAGQSAALGFGVMAAAAGPALIVTGKLVEAYGTLKTTTAGAALSTRFAALALNPYALGAVALGAAVLGVTAVVKKQNAEDEQSRKNGVELAVAIGKRRDAALAHEAAVGRVRSTTQALKAAEDQYGKDSAQYRSALDARRKAAADAASTQRDLNAAVKEASDADASSNGEGANGGKDQTVGETTKLTKDLVETEKKLAAAIRDRIKARQEADAQAQTTSAGQTDAYYNEGANAGASPTAADSIAYVAREQKKLNAARDAGKISGDQYVRSAERLERIERVAKDAIAATAKAHADASGKVKAYSGDIATLQGALGQMSKRSADASDALMRMTRTPGNLRAAKEILMDMTAAERKVAFGTANINKILSMIGNVTPSKGWVTSFASDLALARQKASAPIQVRVQLDVGAIRNFNPTNALGGGGGRPKPPAKGAATGGKIIGPGTGTSDDIPAWLSNGEHVWTAAEVRAAGGHGQVEAMRAAVKGGDMPRFAAGGAVGKRPVKGKKESKAAYNKRLAAWRTKYAAATTASDLGGASLDASTADPDVIKKRDKAARDLEATILAQSDALAGKAGANAEVKSTAKQRDALQKQYDGISGKDAAARKRALKPKLDAAKKAAKAAQARYDKLLDTLRDAGNKRRGLAADIVGYNAALDASEEAAGDKSNDDVRADENLRREALGLESLEEEEHRNALNVKRSAAGLSLLNRGDTVNRDGSINRSDPVDAANDQNLEAQLEQSRKRASDAQANYNLGQSEIRTLTGAGDIGRGGGGNAWQAANGASPTIIVNSLTGYDPEIARQVGGVTDRAFSQGGTADVLYSGRG